MINIAFHPLFPLDMGPLHYFSVLGRALFTAQHFERNCLAIVGLRQGSEQAVLHGLSAIEEPAFQKGMCQLCRRTLGQYVNELTKLGVLSDDAGPVFRAALQARNEIAHEVAMDVSERLDSELAERLDHILDLVRKIAAADMIASAIIHLLTKDPLPTRDFFDSYEDQVASWVAEGTFEE